MTQEEQIFVRTKPDDVFARPKVPPPIFFAEENSDIFVVSLPEVLPGLN